MNIKEFVLTKVEPGVCQQVLSNILDRYLDPAFGSLTKKEADLLMIDALEDLSYISYDPSVYEIEEKLRITRSKARTLLYENELREPHDLDKRVKAALAHPILQKDGEFFLLDIENPLVADYLRAKLRGLNYVVDESLSPNLLKLSLEALASIMEYYMDENEREKVRKILVAAGAPDDSLAGILKAILRVIAYKYASEIGSIYVDKVSGYLGAIFNGTSSVLKANFSELFAAIPKKGKSAFSIVHKN